MMKAAIVTGGNKGVGFGIVETLAKALDDNWRVYLTARNIELGQAALKQLTDKGLSNIAFHQLDICDGASINALATDMKAAHPEGINILVNNAGIAYKQASTAAFAEQAEVTMRTNFTATLEVCRKLTPLLAKDAKVVNVSSLVCTMAFKKCGSDLQKRLRSPLSTSETESLMAEFVQAAKDGTYEAKGWPSMAYGASKIGVTLMTIAMANELKSDPRGIIVNACCPGYVDTDMTSHKGPKTILEGADTPSYLALLPLGQKELNGQFVSDRIAKPWTG